MSILLKIVAAMMITIVSSEAHANVALEGVGFGSVQDVRGREVVLKGTGIIRYLGLIKLSVAGFYLPPDVSPDLALADVPRRLELEYLHAIKKEDFAESTRVWIRKNTSDEAYARLQPQIERFNALYEDVSPGDRYALTYDPVHGTTLALNGEIKGRVDGAEFSAALFSIWIGAKPLSGKLRADLLGKS